jgi:hypothetical protein
MREILYTVSRNGTPFVKIDWLAEFPSLDTEQSRFVCQKAGSLAFAQSLLVPAPPGYAGIGAIITHRFHRSQGSDAFSAYRAD